MDHILGQKPVDPDAARALHELARLDMRLVLASNTLPGESRWPALQAAGVEELFTVALLSHALGAAKPEDIFYELVITAAQCEPSEILFVGDNISHDVIAPLSHGMRAALVRPRGLKPTETLPTGVPCIRHVKELPSLLERS
ncbi:HAD family hydrolase [Spirillospora sp. CA-294931]|uniref:HAD family hydrolase n=1 Tax=Spirillospora sp. CA-294931 TaxID=3240042 RepID=UPI003D9434FB